MRSFVFQHFFVCCLHYALRVGRQMADGIMNVRRSRGRRSPCWRLRPPTIAATQICVCACALLDGVA